MISLFDIFSKWNPEQQDMPPIRKSVRISRRNVQKRVFKQLNTAAPPKRSYARRIGYIPAAFTAVAVLSTSIAFIAAAKENVSGSIYDWLFSNGSTSSLPVSSLYTVPEVEMEDSCENIDIEVLSVYGDEQTATVLLRCTGQNGYQLSETLPMTPVISLDSSEGTGYDCLATAGSTYYDSSDSGALYYAIQIDACNSDLNWDDITLSFSTGLFIDNTSRAYRWRDILKGFGYTNQELNQNIDHIILTKEQAEFVAEHYTASDREVNPGYLLLKSSQISQSEYWYPKESIAVEGTISFSLSLSHPIVSPTYQTFVDNGTQVTMELTPWSATFYWDYSNDMPSFCDMLGISSHGYYRAYCQGIAVLEDGTYTASSPNDSCIFDMSSYPEGSIPPYGNCAMVVMFSQPVDPSTVTAVYYCRSQGDYCVWKSN